MPDYILANTDTEYRGAASLFSEYAAWLNIDLSFQHFEEELGALKQMYAKPSGGIILCREENEFIACVAIRKISGDIGELKRMFVQPAHRKKGIGEALIKKAIELAHHCNYKYIRLDTLNYMQSAIDLYLKHGFKETDAYYNNPNATAVYFELKIEN